MNECRIVQTSLYPYLFIGMKVMHNIYANDLTFWAMDNLDIYEIANELIDVGVDLEEENNAAGFWVLEWNVMQQLVFLNSNKLFSLSKSWKLWDWIMDLLWKRQLLLQNNKNGESPSKEVSYNIVVGCCYI